MKIATRTSYWKADQSSYAHTHRAREHIVFAFREHQMANRMSIANYCGWENGYNQVSLLLWHRITYCTFSCACSASIWSFALKSIREGNRKNRKTHKNGAAQGAGEQTYNYCVVQPVQQFTMDICGKRNGCVCLVRIWINRIGPNGFGYAVTCYNKIQKQNEIGFAIETRWNGSTRGQTTATEIDHKIKFLEITKKPATRRERARGREKWKEEK